LGEGGGGRGLTGLKVEFRRAAEEAFIGQKSNRSLKLPSRAIGKTLQLPLSVITRHKTINHLIVKLFITFMQIHVSL
jgi:hypothetical protein